MKEVTTTLARTHIRISILKLEYDSGTNIYGKEKYSDLFGVSQNIASSWIILLEGWNVLTRKFVFKK